MNRDVPLARYALVAVLGLVLLVGAMLLVRPLIFSVAPERGDANYSVAPVTDLANGAIQRELLLNESHAIAGERPEGRRAAVSVVISEPPVGGIAAVSAWSVANDCAVAIAGDRLRDCAGLTWTFDGTPIEASAPLRRFPAAIRAGAIVVDFTRLAASGD